MGVFFFALRFAARHSPLYFWMKMNMSVFRAAQGFLEGVLAIKVLLDIMEYGRPLSHAVWFLLALFVIAAFISLLNTFMDEYITPRGQEKLNAGMNQVLFDKAASLDLSCYDSPKFYNDFVWSITEANPKVNAVLDKIAGLVEGIVTVLLTGLVFVLLDITGLMFVAVIVALGLVLGKASSKIFYKLDSEKLPRQREWDYVQRVFFLADYAKEIRLFRAAGRLKKEFYGTAAKLMSSYKKHNTRIVLMRFWIDFTGGQFLVQGLYLIYLVFMKVVRQSIGFGDIMVLFNAARNLSYSISGLTENIPSLLTDTLYIKRLQKFLEYESDIRSGGLTIPESLYSIELKNVSFAYGNETVLHNISLSIESDEKIAIVGYNGAGKSTLVKLLLRLYDPTEGEILLNGVNIKEYDLAEYRRVIGAVFQDYQIIAATLFDNVVMDVLDECDETINKSVVEALERSGFTDTLPLYTPLTREFFDNGVNLSGGESQKVAIARLFFKSAGCMVFDEPSGSLDPISEYNVYNAIWDASAGKMVVFISHRLSSTKMADRIFMFERGRVIETGDHDALMAQQDSKYAEMFRKQAESFFFGSHEFINVSLGRLKRRTDFHGTVSDIQGDGFAVGSVDGIINHDF